MRKNRFEKKTNHMYEKNNKSIKKKFLVTSKLYFILEIL